MVCNFIQSELLMKFLCSILKIICSHSMRKQCDEMFSLRLSFVSGFNWSAISVSEVRFVLWNCAQFLSTANLSLFCIMFVNVARMHGLFF